MQIDAITRPTRLEDVTFYHATSTFFLTGIKDSGLAGTQPLAVIEASRFIASIYTQLDNFILSKLDKNKIKFPIENLDISQKVYFSKIQNPEEVWHDTCERLALSIGSLAPQVNTGFFDHGQTYITASRNTALGYLSNQYGSECVSTCADCLPLAEDLKFKINLTPALRDCLNFDHSPLLITISGLKIEWLDQEHSQNQTSIHETVETLLNVFKNNEDPTILQACLQQKNFRLNHPVPMANLEIIHQS